MTTELFNWLLQIPQALAEFGNWLTNPLYAPYITMSPLELLGVAGVSVIIGIIVIHIVRLFVG